MSQFDCGARTEKTLFALNQVRQCHLTPEELEFVQKKIIFYTKHFQKKLNSKKFRKHHQQEKKHCGHNDHSSIDHTLGRNTSDLVISAEQCRSVAKGTMISLADQFSGFEYVTMNPLVITDGSTSNDSRNHCTARGWIVRDIFFPQLQRTTLKVRKSAGRVLSNSAQVLPCALEEPGCETTSLDPYAYISDHPDNCVLSVLRIEEVNMVKQGTKYYIINGPDSATKFVFDVKNNPQKHCGKPTDI